MKKASFLITFMMFVFTSTMFAQTKISIEEPEFTGQVVYVKSPKEGILLQKENAQIKTKAGASVFLTGIGSVKSRMHIDGNASPTRIAQAQKTRFIVRAVDNKTDPLQIINVIRFDIHGKARRAEMSKANTFGGTSSNNMKRVDFNAKKYGEDSYLIELENIEPGEYGIYTTNPIKEDEKNTLIIATFGID